jgi:hypothetical protein
MLLEFILKMLQIFMTTTLYMYLLWDIIIRFNHVRHELNSLVSNPSLNQMKCHSRCKIMFDEYHYPREILHFECLKDSIVDLLIENKVFSPLVKLYSYRRG